MKELRSSGCSVLAQCPTMTHSVLIWILLLFVAVKDELKENNNWIFDLNYKLCKK